MLNLSEHKVSSTELFVLSLGLKFSIPPRTGTIKREHVFSDFESLAGQLYHHTPLSKDHLDSLHTRLYDLTHGFCGTSIDLSEFRMHKECFQTYKTLRQNNNIIITRPDKGSGVVVLDRHKYNNKMMTILSDNTKFEHLGPAETLDITANIEKAFQRRMYKWLKDKSIPLSVYNVIRPTSQRPKLYGLPKIHKQNCPLRPILSMIGSPQHHLAKYLITELQPVLDNYSSNTIKDSFSFVDVLRNIP